jgi:enoyl-CoA hydratase/carnithine racemase
VTKQYESVNIRREDGVVELAFHTDGGSLRWSPAVHEEIGACFADIGADRENAVVILTGTGESFCNDVDLESFKGIQGSPESWDRVLYGGKRLINNLLEIEVPVIGAVNGPAHIHAELPVLSDIVIAAESATFRDGPHFRAGVSPSDGVHVVWPHVIGPNRGRYFLLTGQVLSAQQAMEWGAVSEVVAAEDLLPRAWELAREIAKRPTLARRYAREAMTLELRRLMREHLGYGLALEGLGALGHWPPDQPSDF